MLLPDLFASQSPTATGVPVPLWLDLTAVVVGSFSGIFYARERKLDLVGFIALAIICGLGGGLVRDTIMQVNDVYMLQSNGPILVTVLTGVLGFLFPASIMTHPQAFDWVDIISVGLFAAAGTDKAIVYQLRITAVIFMGVITGVGGGMLRDVFLGEVPHIFKRSNWYALCAVAGSAAYYLCVVPLGLSKEWAVLACVLVTALLRRISLHYNLYSPADVDLGPAVKRGAQQVAESAVSRGKAEGSTLMGQFHNTESSRTRQSTRHK